MVGAKGRGWLVVFLAASALASVRAAADGIGLDEAERSWREGRRAERAGSDACVDAYYRAAVLATRELSGPDADLALPLANDALARCLLLGQAHGRLDPRSRLLLRDGGGLRAVPVVHRGFAWRPEDFSVIRGASSVQPDKNLVRRRERPGVGVPLVVLRAKRGDASDDFHIKDQPFAATAVLRSGAGGDLVEFCDPHRIVTVSQGGRTFPLAADLDAPLSVLIERGIERYRLEGVLNAEKTAGLAGLYLLEPHQPGKVPVVLVHGLASSPLTWHDMIGDLMADPAFNSRYQLAFFTYPTGSGLMFSMAKMREDLRRYRSLAGADPAADRMVLIGHSMGGLLAKMQVTWSESLLWDELFRMRPEQTRLTPELLDLIRRLLFFEPVPFVRTVIFIGTPHRGSNRARDIITVLGSRLLIRKPSEAQRMFREFIAANPGVLRDHHSRIESNVEILRPENPIIQTLNRLPRAPWTTWYTIYGDRGRPHSLVPTDGYVPVESARIAGVASELLLPLKHTELHHDARAVAEVRRILGLPASAPTGR